MFVLESFAQQKNNNNNNNNNTGAYQQYLQEQASFQQHQQQQLQQQQSSGAALQVMRAVSERQGGAHVPQADHHIAAAGTVREESPDKGGGPGVGGSMGAAPVEADAFDADFDSRDAPQLRRRNPARPIRRGNRRRGPG